MSFGLQDVIEMHDSIESGEALSLVRECLTVMRSATRDSTDVQIHISHLIDSGALDSHGLVVAALFDCITMAMVTIDSEVIDALTTEVESNRRRDIGGSTNADQD